MTDRQATAGESAGAQGFGAGIAQKALEPLLRAVRDEIGAAKSEIGDRVTGAKRGVILAVVGGVLALVALGLLAALIVALLALSLTMWASLAVTLLVFAVAAAILLSVGIRSIGRGVPPLPRDTLTKATSHEH
ncbi:phage holin family protein [Frondihabitans peucedani]|uniref:Phage holin family protein n=1 Tax=Frondihabitans peucedani TaxID=598626 RepID=A0ABP8E6E4_9MICO